MFSWMNQINSRIFEILRFCFTNNLFTLRGCQIWQPGVGLFELWPHSVIRSGYTGIRSLTVGMISVVTHPESPKMMTFKSTFFLEVILPQLKEDKEKMFRQGCLYAVPSSVNTSTNPLTFVSTCCMYAQVARNQAYQLSVPHVPVMWFLSC